MKESLDQTQSKKLNVSFLRDLVCSVLLLATPAIREALQKFLVSQVQVVGLHLLLETFFFLLKQRRKTVFTFLIQHFIRRNAVIFPVLQRNQSALAVRTDGEYYEYSEFCQEGFPVVFWSLHLHLKHVLLDHSFND